MKIILIMGLSGSGKTFFAEKLKFFLEKNGNSVEWYNADTIRDLNNDWDFSIEGRIRQSIRMKELANKSMCDYVILDLIAPLPKMREIISADYVVWVDVIKNSIYPDTDKLFVDPVDYSIKITDWDYNKWINILKVV